MSIAIVGLVGGAWFGPDALEEVCAADVLIGAARHHEALADQLDSVDRRAVGEAVELFGPLDQIIDLIAERDGRGERVVVLASGDPGFFGIARLLIGRFGAAGSASAAGVAEADSGVRSFPAPSSVALAAARAGVTWDDAAVVSCHGRPLEHAVPHIVAAPKVAVLVSAANDPSRLGRALIDAGAAHRHAFVCSRLGEPEESVTRTDLAGLAAGSFNPLSVVILTSSPSRGGDGDDDDDGAGATLAWGRPIGDYRHRASLITKPEVRAVALSKLELFAGATLWDVGAASGSVAIEAARMAPGLRAFAIERDAELCDDIRANARRVAVTVVEGTAPEAFVGLADPDRVFVGGGGIEVLDAALARLARGGVAAATFAVLETALAAQERLGNMVQLNVNRAVPIGENGRLRLEADNPVFVVWGTP